MPTTITRPDTTLAPRQAATHCRTCGDRLAPTEARSVELAGECRDCPRRRRIRAKIAAHRPATARWCPEVHGPQICRTCHCERAVIERHSDDELSGLCQECHDAGHR